MDDPIELERVRIVLRSLANLASNHNETGFVTAQYKRQLVEMKWYIEDLIDTVGYFAGEELWEQDRLIEVLKRKEVENA